MMQHYKIEKAAEHLFAHRHPFGVQAQFLPQLAFVGQHAALSGSGPRSSVGQVRTRLSAGAKGVRTTSPTVNGADMGGPAPTTAITRDRSLSVRHLSSATRGTRSSNRLFSSAESGANLRRDPKSSANLLRSPSVKGVTASTV
jgi:hypothetical protein